MTRLDVQSQLRLLLDLMRICFPIKPPALTDGQIEQRLRILRVAPEPHLEEARARVIAEAAHLESRSWEPGNTARRGRLSLLGTAAATLLSVSILTIVLVLASGSGATPPSSGANNPPGSAVMTASVTEAEHPVATSNPAPVRVSMTVPAAAATPAPASRPAMFLTGTEIPPSPNEFR